MPTEKPLDMDIPPDIVSKLLLDARFSIFAMLNFEFPPIFDDTSIEQWPDEYFNEDSPSSTDIRKIAQLPIPPTSVIGAIIAAVKSNGYALKAKSVNYAHTPDEQQTYPLWVISYWEGVLHLHDAHHMWSSALESLKRSVTDEEVLQKSCEALDNLPWSGKIQGFPSNSTGSTTILSCYFTAQWLSEEHINQILELLRDDLDANEKVSINIQDAYFFPKMKDGFVDQEKYTSSKVFRWCREEGHNLETGVYDQLGFVVHIGGNHWVGVVCDFRKGVIWGGDSLANEFNKGVIKTLEWWTYFHSGRRFKFKALPITRQTDVHSCGILACNAVAHFMLGNIALVEANGVFTERLRIFHRVVDKHLEALVSFGPPMSLTRS